MSKRKFKFICLVLAVVMLGLGAMPVLAVEEVEEISDICCVSERVESSEPPCSRGAGHQFTYYYWENTPDQNWTYIWWFCDFCPYTRLVKVAIR